MTGRLFTIGPDAPFLETLADEILTGPLVEPAVRKGSFWLSSVTIYLPTRRARDRLTEIFLTRSGGGLLLPEIRTLGGTLATPEPADDAPGVVHPLTRQLVLARLIHQWAAREVATGAATGFSLPPEDGEVLGLADSLGQVIDDFLIEERPIEALREIVPDHLAENWQRTLDFLKVVLEFWPDWLAETGKADAAALRHEDMDRETEALVKRAGLTMGPVIAAGSTGSVPATARRLAAIAGLDHGRIVLPGLDTRLRADDLGKLAGGYELAHAHPQFGLVQLLGRLGARPDDVIELGAAASDRTNLIRRALGFAGQGPVSEPDATALDNVTLVEAENADLEARAVALAAAEALSQPGCRVGIVTVDRDLARRIAAELQRYGIDLDDGAGTPLMQTRAGRLVRQAIETAAGFAPLPVMALLGNRHVTLGLSRAEMARRGALLELGALRGVPARPGIAGLVRMVRDAADGKVTHRPLRLSPDDAADILDLLARLETALAPVSALLAEPAVRFADLATALTATIATLTGPAEGKADELEGAPEIAAFLTRLAMAPEAAPPLRPEGIIAALWPMLARETVPASRPGPANIALWGTLEARLQSADVMILAGLNEGVWPQTSDPGPWLTRGMRLAAGLEPSERRTGLAAHDFQMLAGADTLLLTRARRSQTGPATPSAFLQRLSAFAGAKARKTASRRGDALLARAASLDYAGIPVPATRPAPCPAVADRPKSLSITEIETLIRNPYAIYARHVLGLKDLDPLAGEPGPAERGRLIHAVLERFVRAGHDPLAATARDLLAGLIDAALADFVDSAERRANWRRRLMAMADAYLVWESGRSDRIAQRHAELKGSYTVNLDGTPFTLNGRADRIDLRTDGRAEIIDFKTGSVPTTRNMSHFLAPQLPLEVRLLQFGGFQNLTAVNTAELGFVKFAHGPDALNEAAFLPSSRHGWVDDTDPMSVADAYWRRLSSFVDLLLMRDALPMHARLIPEAPYPDPYDDLARVAEWGTLAGDED